MSQTEQKYCEIKISIDGQISAEHLVTEANRGHGWVTNIWRIESVLPRLADGGYVIDLRPLYNHPQIVKWSLSRPLCNGKIEGDDIDYITEEQRQTARQFLDSKGLGGAFETIAIMMACHLGELEEDSAGPFDYVSSTYRANYWLRRGARIGKRQGDTLYWSDGQEEILPK